MKASNEKTIRADYAQKLWNQIFSGYLVVIGGKPEYTPALFFTKGTTLYAWNSELGEMQRDDMSREDFCKHIENMYLKGFEITTVKIK